jgi:hypothetical protein
MLPSRDTAAESTRFVRADLLSAALACYPSASASTSPCACAPDAASPSHSHPLDAQSILISLFLNGREQRRKGGRRSSCPCRLPSKPYRRGGARSAGRKAPSLRPHRTASSCSDLRTSSDGQRLVQWRFGRATTPYRPSPATTAAGGPYGGVRVAGRRLPCSANVTGPRGRKAARQRRGQGSPSPSSPDLRWWPTHRSQPARLW